MGFKRRVNELFEQEVAQRKGKFNKVEKELLKEQIENTVFASEVKVSGSGFQPPSIVSLIGVRAVLLPLTITRRIYEFCKWHWRFSIQRESYGNIEKTYLTRRALGISEDGWETLEENQQQDYISRCLWEPAQMQAFRAEKQEEMRQKMLNSGAYKRNKRWMRNHCVQPC